MARRKKSGWGGFLIGPALILASLVVLYKNEARYDYSREAAGTIVLQDVAEGTEGQLISCTGPMDQSLTIRGKYVDAFVGYLVVYRSAEIYAWDRDEDDDNHVTWRQEWMSSPQSNSRNSSITQTLSSDDCRPAVYRVGELPVAEERIEFVDSTESITTNGLLLSDEGKTHHLRSDGDKFYLSKGKADRLGDERLSYTGVPVPAIGTYFGKYAGGKGVAYDDNLRTDMISSLIQDSGVLHHLVAGERSVALATMKQHIATLKWIIRGIGTALTVLGFLIMISSMLSLVYALPIIGPMAEWGAWILAILIGVPVALLTISISFLLSNPLWLVLLVVVGAGFVYMIRRKGRKTQDAMQQHLAQAYGHVVEPDEYVDLEYRELVHLAISDADFGEPEMEFLYEWGKKHGWDREKCDSVIDSVQANHASGLSGGEAKEATDEHLKNLILLAMADGSVTVYEMRAIRRAASKLGYDESMIRDLQMQIRQSASVESNAVAG